MGVFKKNRFKGKLGKIVSRDFLGIEVGQSVPRPYENTTSSQISALEKGIASTSGRIIRENLLPLNCRFDEMMHSRFAGDLRTCIYESKTALPGKRDLHDADLSKIIGFQLNKFSPLSKMLRVRPQAELRPEGGILVKLDRISEKQDIKSIDNCSHVVIRFLCFAINFRHEQQRFISCKDFTLSKESILEAQEYFIDFKVPDNTLLFLTCSLHWLKKRSITGNEILNTKNFSPAEIIGAWKYSSGKADIEDADFSNADIEDSEYHWEETSGYKGKMLLKKAAELFEKGTPEKKAKVKKKKENQPFPFDE